MKQSLQHLSLSYPQEPQRVESLSSFRSKNVPQIITNSVGGCNNLRREPSTGQESCNYDARVPLILMGLGIRPGRYERDVLATDLAPTLGRLMGLDYPARKPSAVLEEALEKAAAPAAVR